jgi:hypothetical protein
MVIPLSGFDFLPLSWIYTPLYKFNFGGLHRASPMFANLHPTQPADAKPLAAIDTEKPITIDAINDVWFLVVALIAVVAYCVRVELGVKDCQSRLNKVENEVIPGLRKELADVELHFESTLQEAKRMFATELRNALDAQRDFIAGQTNVILEKISNIKEQSDRQGREIREFNGMLACQKRHQAQFDDD